MYKYLKVEEQAQEYLFLIRQWIKYQLLTRQETGPNEILENHKSGKTTLKPADSKTI